MFCKQDIVITQFSKCGCGDVYYKMECFCNDDEARSGVAMESKYKHWAMGWWKAFCERIKRRYDKDTIFQMNYLPKQKEIILKNAKPKY